MKKIKFIVAFLILLFLFSGISFAAGTITATTDYSYSGMTGKEIRVITYAVAWDGSADAPATIALGSIATTTTNVRGKNPIAGWWLFKLDIYPGATGPTDDTGVYIYTVEDKIDILGGNGADACDESTVSTVYPATAAQPLIGSELIKFTGNAVNSATTTIIMTLYRN